MLRQTLSTASLRQYGRFAATGVLNTAVDFGVLNALLFATAHLSQSGLRHSWYLAFKAVSFLAAVANSWFLNRHWVFKGHGPARPSAKREGILFLLVSCFGFALNLAVSLVAFATLSRMGLWSEVGRANAGSIAGTAISLVFNFFGYKLLIFKTRHDGPQTTIPLGYSPRVQGGGAHRGDAA